MLSSLVYLGFVICGSCIWILVYQVRIGLRLDQSSANSDAQREENELEVSMEELEEAEVHQDAK